MSFIKNILALIGLLAVVGVVYGYQKFGSDIEVLSHFDAKFKTTYMQMWDTLKKTGNSADATVWVVPLEEGVSPEDAEEAMSIVANDLNIVSVGEQPLSEQVALQTGEDQRFLKIFQYCDPATAMKMVEHTDASYLRGDVLVVRHAAPWVETGALKDNRIYLRSSLFDGKTFIGKEAGKIPDNVVPDTPNDVREIQAHGYFVGPSGRSCGGADVPSLFRISLDDDGKPFVSELLPGIEHF